MVSNLMCASFVLLLRLLFAGIVINALLMILAPVLWHRTPWWFRALSGLPGDRYPDGRNARRIRLTGTVLLIIVTGLAYTILCRPQPKSSIYVVRLK
jgi:hypothetical protein